MPRFTEKGLTPPPYNLQNTNPELFRWLSVAQLQIPKIHTYQTAIDLASIDATSYSTQTFTVTGLDTNDVIAVNPPALTSGLYLLSYRVSAADTVSLVFYNSTGGAIDEASGTYNIVACRL